MKGIILINAYSDMQGMLHQSARLKEELNKRGVEAEVRRNDFFAVSCNEELICSLSGYDFCVYFDKDKYVLQGIERAGVPLFNSYAAVEACDDKMTTCLTLANNNIPMPLTLPALFCYESEAKIAEESLDKIESALGYPLVVKECYGSRGAGVWLVNDRSQLKEISNKLKCTPHLYQEFISNSFGKDVRVIVVGGKALGAMLRTAQSDFRSNVALGGSASEYALNKEAIAMCERVASLLGLDYCGIDLLFGGDGRFYVCEVNSNAFFYGFEEATKKNVAGAYAEHILSVLNRNGRR